MLVLTRKKGESIRIGDDIEITISSIKGDQVKIGIDAPKNVEIHRKEVWLEIQNENTAHQKKSQICSQFYQKQKKIKIFSENY